MKQVIKCLLIVLSLVAVVIMFRFYEVSQVEADISHLSARRTEFKEITVRKSKPGLYVDGRLNSRADLFKLLEE
jgi:hypothetical protein